MSATATNTTIDISAVQALKNEFAPLYMRYDGQINPQPAYLELTEDGKVSANYQAEIGHYSTTMDVWHGRTLQWDLPPWAKGWAIAEFVEDQEVFALLERIHRGHKIWWNGSNMVGSLVTEDAIEASKELQELIDDYFSNERTCVEVYDIDEWIDDSPLQNIWPANKDLDEAVEDIVDNAEFDDVIVEGDIHSALLERAREEYKKGSDQIGPVHIQALREAGMIDDELAE